MDCSPLNLAHFHERRSEKFLRYHRYDDAQKAIATSLFYLQDAFRVCQFPKSLEVLNTQKWEYERKFNQIQLRKQQHERMKVKEIVPLPPETNTAAAQRTEQAQVTGQSAAKSIDKTIREFDAKFVPTLVGQPTECTDAKDNTAGAAVALGNSSRSEQNNRSDGSTAPAKQDTTQNDGNDALLPESNSSHQSDMLLLLDSVDEMPMLEPLEMPCFDLSAFISSTPNMAYMANLAESLQK